MVMNAMSVMKKTKQQLHESGFKLTPQREATLLVLLENEKEHLSAEEVFFLVKKKSPEIGLATVYRTLEILTDLKIIDKVNFNDGVARYDLRKEGAKHFHHHLLCLKCGTIEEVEEDLIDSGRRSSRGPLSLFSKRSSAKLFTVSAKNVIIRKKKVKPSNGTDGFFFVCT